MMYKNQKGFSLLMALVCIVIFTVLGLSLLKLTSNAYLKNETRSNNIQADALATKGSDYIVAYINNKFLEKATEVKAKVTTEVEKNKQLNPDTLTKNYLAIEMDKILLDLSCTKNMVEQTSSYMDVSKYGYCVVIQPNQTFVDRNNMTADSTTWYTIDMKDSDRMKRIVTLHSIGNVKADQATSDLYVRKVLGVDVGVSSPGTEGTGGNGTEPGTGGTGVEETVTNGLANVADIPVALKYALQTKKTGMSGTAEDGAVFLHGGVDIFGELNIDGNLYAGQLGMPSYNSYKFSSYPRVFAHKKDTLYNASLLERTAGTVSVTGNVYRWGKNPNDITYNKEEHRLYKLVPSNYATKFGLSNTTPQSNAFSNEGVIIKKISNINNDQNLNVNYVELKEKFDKAFKDNGKTVSNSCTQTSFTGYFVNCSNTVSITNNGTKLQLTQKENNADISKRGGIAYVKGLKISAGTEKNPVVIKGTYFIDGDLDIGSNYVDFDAVLYVTGDVDIQGSNLNSLVSKVNGKDQQGTVLIFAKGSLTLAKISDDESTPSNMKAFLHSDKDIRITGSKSHVLINGGISGRSIELTGMRGPTTSNLKDSCKNVTVNNTTGCQSIANLMEIWKNTSSSTDKTKLETQMRSRLTVYYNPDIIITYQQYAVETKAVIPDITISTPTEYDRDRK